MSYSEIALPEYQVRPILPVGLLRLHPTRALSSSPACLGCWGKTTVTT